MENYQNNTPEYGGSYEIQRHSKYSTRGSVLGYVLGLTGSVFALIFCGIMFFLFMWFKAIAKDLFFILSQALYEIFDVSYPFWGGFYGEESFMFLIPIFVLILIGAIIGLIGTIKSFKHVSVESSTLMLISGVILLFCFIVPGIVLIIGGTVNLRKFFINNR